MAKRKPKTPDLSQALAEANAAPVKPKRTRRKAGQGYEFVVEDIVAERDEKGLSWRQVALNLELPGPSAARKAYSELTGKHHSESTPIVNRAPKGSMTLGGRKLISPEWNDESDQDEIIEKLQDATITVRRTRGLEACDEEVRVKCVQSLRYDGKEEDGDLVVNVTQMLRSEKRRGWEPGPTRTFRVADIVNVR